VKKSHCLLVFVVCFLACLVLVYSAWADFLACDCTPATDKVTAFKVKINSGAYIDTPAVLSCGTTTMITCTGDSRTMCYNMATVPVGATIVAQAGDATGRWSIDSLPFVYTVIGSPSLKLVR
jgi:hypothetical protein